MGTDYILTLRYRPCIIHRVGIIFTHHYNKLIRELNKLYSVNHGVLLECISICLNLQILYLSTDDINFRDK